MILYIQINVQYIFLFISLFSLILSTMQDLIFSSIKLETLPLYHLSVGCKWFSLLTRDYFNIFTIQKNVNESIKVL